MRAASNSQLLRAVSHCSRCFKATFPKLFQMHASPQHPVTTCHHHDKLICWACLARPCLEVCASCSSNGLARARALGVGAASPACNMLVQAWRFDANVLDLLVWLFGHSFPARVGCLAGVALSQLRLASLLFHRTDENRNRTWNADILCHSCSRPTLLFLSQFCRLLQRRKSLSSNKAATTSQRAGSTSLPGQLN